MTETTPITVWLKRGARESITRGVAVRIGEPGAHDASSTIPAATVSFVASSIRMNAPVARLRA